jgi:hypothetical protein
VQGRSVVLCLTGTLRLQGSCETSSRLTTLYLFCALALATLEKPGARSVYLPYTYVLLALYGLPYTSSLTYALPALLALEHLLVLATLYLSYLPLLPTLYFLSYLPYTSSLTLQQLP